MTVLGPLLAILLLVACRAGASEPRYPTDGPISAQIVASAPFSSTTASANHREAGTGLDGEAVAEFRGSVRSNNQSPKNFPHTRLMVGISFVTTGEQAGQGVFHDITAKSGRQRMPPLLMRDEKGHAPMIQIGLSLTGLMMTTGNAVPPADGETPPLPAYYPAVSAVDLSAAGGSLQLPEGNWMPAASARSETAMYKGFLAQSRNNLAFAASSVPQAFFAIVRLPLDKRDGSRNMAIAGTSPNTNGDANKFLLTMIEPEFSTEASRNKFRFQRRGASGTSYTYGSLPWDEDAALVVAWMDGTGIGAVDWYSLKDGTRHAGPENSVTIAASSVTAPFNIGHAGGVTEFTTNLQPEWTAGGNAAATIIRPWQGEISAIGYVNGAHVTPEQWASIAGGARLQDVLPVGNVSFVREFDGTAASLARPAWATADNTLPSSPVGSTTTGVPGSRLVPGSTFRRQSLASYVLIDEKSAGMVYGLKPGQTQRAVPFSGVASGNVEVRIHDAVDGKVVLDWTAMPATVNGAWSGSLVLPESERGWILAEARLIAAPSVVAHAQSPFGVGWKFMIMGQSQTAYPMALTTTRLSLDDPMGGSTAGLIQLGTRAAMGTASRYPSLRRIGAGTAGDGFVAFLNQFRKFKPATPVMIIREAVPGTSMETLLSGAVGNSDRSWADLTDKLDLYGRDVTAVLWNWLMNEGSASGSDVNRLMSAMFLSPAGGSLPKSLVTELESGWTLGVLAGDRESSITGREGMRAARTAFAYTNSFTLGPTVSDYRINNAGGPHPGEQFTSPAGGAAGGYTPPETFDNGSARFMQRMAVMAAQTIGEMPDAAVHPYYANPRFNGDGTKILVDVVAVNGGTIYSPAPTALRSWLVKEPADSTFATTLAKSASAVLNTTVYPPRVEITRNSGAWPEGTQVQRMDDGEKRAADDGAAEDAIHAGGIYESWPDDPLGFGFPVVGKLDAGGKWRNLFSETVVAN